jgi:tight adherence protein B
MTTVLCSSLAAAVAVWLRRPDDWLVVRHRLGRPGNEREPWAPPTLLVAVAATCVAGVAVPSTPAQIALVAIAAAGLFALRLRRGARQRAETAAFRADVARVIRSASAELRAGVDPVAALRAATGGTALHWGYLPLAGEQRAWGTDASSARAGGTSLLEAQRRAWETIHAAAATDVRTALHAAASTPGGEGLADVAGAWHLAEQTGAPLAVILDRIAGSIQAEVELDREVAVEAGPARATARLMAVLPIFGLGLGLLLGVNPVAVLVGSGLGVTCLIAGLALACCGIWWIERIVSALDGPPSTVLPRKREVPPVQGGAGS